MDDAPRTNPLLACPLFSIYPVTVSIEYPHYSRVPRLQSPHRQNGGERPPRALAVGADRDRQIAPQRADCGPPRRTGRGVLATAAQATCLPFPVHFGARARGVGRGGRPAVAQQVRVIVNHDATACVPDSNHLLMLPQPKVSRTQPSNPEE